LPNAHKALKEFVSGGIEVKTDPRDPLGLLVLVLKILLAFKLDRADIRLPVTPSCGPLYPSCPRLLLTEVFKEVNSIIVEGHTDFVRERPGIIGT